MNTKSTADDSHFFPSVAVCLALITKNYSPSAHFPTQRLPYTILNPWKLTSFTVLVQKGFGSGLGIISRKHEPKVVFQPCQQQKPLGVSCLATVARLVSERGGPFAFKEKRHSFAMPWDHFSASTSWSCGKDLYLHVT